MKRSKYAESQIVFAIKQVETGARLSEVFRKMGISEVTSYNWKKKYRNLGGRVQEIEEPCPVKEVSRRSGILQDVLKKSSKPVSKAQDGR